MKCVILCSTSDDASINIRDRLVESFGFKETDNLLLGHRVYSRDDGIILVTIDSLHIYADEEVQKIDADLIVVASRHVSEAGVKAMLAHPVGNWKEAQYGGRPKTVVRTSAYAIYAAVTKLKELLEDNMLIKDTQVGMEATHHGPYSKTPLIFVELGSSEREWRDERLAEIVAEACIAACKHEKLGSKPEPAVGFGGSHYAPKFTPLVLDGENALGHIAPKYGFPLDKELIKAAFESTIEKPKLAYIDWKGLKSEDRQSLLKTLEELGYDYVKI